MAMVFFVLFFILKPLYIFPSGGLGLADIFLFLCAVTLFWEWLSQRKEGKGSGLLDWKEDGALYVFLAAVVLINGIYSWREQNTEFIRYTAYWLYSVMAVWCFRRLSKKDGFSRWILNGAQFNVLVQTGFWISGQGRIFYEYWGGTRYMGTFNDPNQLAFFLFLMAILLYLARGEKKNIFDILFYGLALLLIAVSKSTGIFLGVLIAAAAWGMQVLWRIYRSGRVDRKILGIILGACLIVFAAVMIYLWPPADFSVREGNYTLVERIQEKIWKAVYGGGSSFFMDRGLEKCWLYPQYLLYGAGEGGFARFTLASQVNEIHSCLFSILFCYGLIPTILLMYWLMKELRRLEGWMWPMILGLLAESFLLVNYRQPMFWLVLIWGSLNVPGVQARGIRCVRKG